MSNLIILPSGERVHDYRENTLRWGHNGMNWHVAPDRKSVTMQGIGKGVRTGDYLAVSQGGNVNGYKFERVKYYNNPSDMFEAILSGVYEFEEGDLP